MQAKLLARIICVSDLEKSVAFYRDVFSFEAGVLFESEGAFMNALTQLSDVSVRAQMMSNAAGACVELVQFSSPAYVGSGDVPSIARWGITQLAFIVESLDVTCDRIVRAGGMPIRETRVVMPLKTGDLPGMFICDPDGVRIEILESGSGDAKLLWNALCVEDIDRSVAFYRCLGFEPAETTSFDESDWLSRLNAIDGLRLRVQIVRDQHGNAIELVKVLSHRPAENGAPRPFNRPGLVNLVFDVDDRNAVGKALRSYGGEMFDDTVVELDYDGATIRQWHGMDPDGSRIELVEKPVLVVHQLVEGVLS